jgi:hypothetical protein
VRVAGMATSRADYRADVGPVDASMILKGATFACQASPALPDRLRIWLEPGPHEGELTGRHLDFWPVPSGRDAAR